MGEKESVYGRERVCVRESGRESGRECRRAWGRVRERVCGRERVCVGECVCVRESERMWVRV